MLNQVSLFTENNKGSLFQVTSVLAKAGANIFTMLAGDGPEFGIIRIIVNNPDATISALQAAGYQCRLAKVVAIKMSDEPGSLAKILKDLNEANINIDYLYISYDRQAALPVAIVKTGEPETETFLSGKGYELMDSF